MFKINDTLTISDKNEPFIIAEAGINHDGEFEKAIELIKNGKLKKNDVKFFLGYSGWDKNQLKAEIEDGSWHILKKINDNDVLDDKSNLWKLKLEELGEYFKIWSNSPENPNLN